MNRFKKADQINCTVWIAFILGFIFFCLPGIGFSAFDKPTDDIEKKVGPIRTDISQINSMNRVHRRSNIWLNISNSC